MAIREFTGDLDEAEEVTAEISGVAREFDGELDAPTEEAGGRFDELMARQREYDDTYSVGDKVEMGLTAGMESLRASKAMGAAVGAAEDYTAFQESQPGLISAQPSGWRKPTKSAISARPGEPIDPLTGTPLVSFGGELSSLGEEAVAEGFKRKKDLLDSAIARNIKHAGKAAAIPMSPVAEAAMNAETFGEAWDVAKQDPVAFIMDTGVRSAPFMVEPIVAGVVGAAAGGIPGFMAATGLGSAHVDYAASLGEALQRQGVDATDPEAVKAALLDNGVLSSIKKEAKTHAAFVGLFDGLTAGLASKTLAPKAISQPMAREFVNLVNQFGAQAVGGMAGEASGQYASTGEVHSPGEVLAEGAGEMISAPADIISATTTGLRETKEGIPPATDMLGASEIAADMERSTSTGDPVQDSVNDLLNEADRPAATGPTGQPLDSFSEAIATQNAARQAEIDAAMPQEAGPGFRVSPELRAQTPQAQGGRVTAPLAQEAQPDVLQDGIPNQATAFDVVTRESGAVLVRGDKTAIRQRLAESGIDAKGIPSADGLIFGKSTANVIQEALLQPGAVSETQVAGMQPATAAEVGAAPDAGVAQGQQGEQATVATAATETGGMLAPVQGGPVAEVLPAQGAQELPGAEAEPQASYTVETLDDENIIITGDKDAISGKLRDAGLNKGLWSAELNGVVMPKRQEAEVREALTGDRRNRQESVLDDQRSGQERRQNKSARAYYESLTKDQLLDELLKHELTGIKGRRSFVREQGEAKKLISIDADSLKWINDNMSPEAGDRLLQAVADALVYEFGFDYAYHISGDEFYVVDDGVMTDSELTEAMARVQKRLDQATITVTKDDGTVISKQGLVATYAIGKDRSSADAELKREKAAREERGERAGRGEEPPGVSRKSPAVPAAAGTGQQGGGDTAATGPEPSNGQADTRTENEKQVTAPKQTTADTGVSASEGRGLTANAPQVLPPNSVVAESRDRDGRLIGYFNEPHDGTDEGKRAANQRLRDRLKKDPEWSNVNTRAGVTDADGNPVEVISPNGRNISPADAAYTFGDIDAKKGITKKTPKRSVTDFQVGDRVRHNDGSLGTVTGQEGDTVLVDFDDSDTGPVAMVPYVFRKEESAPAESQRSESTQAPAKPSKADEKKATSILDAANVLGKDRLDIMLDYRDGKYSLKDLQAAYPPAESAATEEQALEQGSVAAVIEKEDRPGAQETDTGDAGDELYANRRGVLRGGVKWSDVARLNDTLKVRETTKTKVWPRPNYQEMVDGGMNRVIAFRVKQIYDSISTTPNIRGVATDEDLKTYIETVNDVREAVDSWVNNTAAKASFANSISRLSFASHISDQIQADREFDAKDSTFIIDRVFPKAEGDRSIFGGTSEQAKENNRRASIIGGKKPVSAIQTPDRAEVRRMMKSLEDGWPAKQEAWQRRGLKVLETAASTEVLPTNVDGKYYLRVGGRYHQSFSTEREAIEAQDRMRPWVLTSKTGRIIGEFDSQEAATEAARSEAAPKRGKQEIAPEGTSVEEAVRVGEARRDEGENVSSEKVKDTFGFRGINFGNWMKGKANEAERQAHINHAYDSMLDLAELLNIPPKAIGLNGTIGLAVGAQGQGGKGVSAAAHFVPGVNEINLTRKQGAGSLAHEWAHALDHYFAVQSSEKLAKSDDPFLSTINNRPGLQELDARKEIVDAFRSIQKTMTKRMETQEEYEARIQKYIESAEKDFDKAEIHFTKVLKWKDAGEAATQKTMDAIKELRGKELSGEYVKLSRSKTDLGVPKEIAAIGDLIKEATNEKASKEDLQWLSRVVRSYNATRNTEGYREAHSRLERKTKFYGRAKGADASKGGKPYWATPWEMFARSFEMYVMDKLAAKASRNDYLVAASKSLTDEDVEKVTDDLIADVMRETTSRYPQGEERASINEAFDSLVNEIKVKETDEGVALYAKDIYRGSAETGLPVADVEAITAKMALSWGGNARTIHVHKDVGGMPERLSRQIAKGDEGEVQGVHDPVTGDVHLIADNLPTKRDVNRILAHEMAGHTGMEEIVDRGDVIKGGWKAVERRIDTMVKAGNKQAVKLHDEVMSRGYGSFAVDIKEKYITDEMREQAEGDGGYIVAENKIVFNLRKSAYDFSAMVDGSTVTDQTDRATVTKEMLAVAVERNVTSGPIGKLLQQIRAAIRSLLRKAGINSVLPSADIDAMVIASLRYLKGSDSQRTTYPDTLEHPQIGEISVKVGNGRTGASKFAETAPEVAEQLEDLVSGAKLVQRDRESATLENAGTIFHLIKENGRWSLTDAASLSRSSSIEAESFERWFGDSKVVDEEGNPLVVYHGTTSDVSEFDLSLSGKVGERFAEAAFFTSDPQIASGYAALATKNPEFMTAVRASESARAAFGAAVVEEGLDSSRAASAKEVYNEAAARKSRLMQEVWRMERPVPGANVIPAYLSIKSPLEINGMGRNWREVHPDAFEQAANGNYDGLIIRDVLDAPNTESSVPSDIFVALSPKQVKSAIGNRGTFDPNDPRINFARKRQVKKSAFQEENNRIREQDRNLWDKSKTFLKRQLAPGGLLPKSVFEAKIARDSQFEVVEFDSQHLIGQLELAVKADYGKAFGSLDEATENTLNDALTGKVDDAIPERTKKTIVAMRQYIDVLSNKYVDILERQANDLVAKANETGSDADKSAAIAKLQLMETITSNQGKYAHRSYRAFDDPSWPKKVPDKVLDDARDYLVNRHLEKGETQEEALRLAEVAINEILKNGTAYDSMEGMIRESKLGAKDLSVLKKRKEIAPEIRSLLGEYKDARLNFVKSTTKMGRLIWNETFLERVLEVGMGTFLFKGTNRPPQATKQIAGKASDTYSPLNGLWTFPETEQAFKDALGKEQMANWYRTIVQINGMVKFGKTVLAPTTAMRNWQSAMLFAVANGHFDMRHMSKSLSALREYFTHQGEGEKLRYLRKLKQLGVVYDTPYAGEMMRLLDDTNIENKILSGKGQMAMRETLGYAQKFYQFGDDFWKIIGFENEKRLLMEKAEMTEAEAEKEAAERIRSTYPTYSMIGRGVQSLRRFPLAGTFVSFPAEIIRTTGNMFHYVAKDMQDPKMRPIAMRRAAGLAIASGFAYGLQALSMAWFGVDDDEDEAVRLLAAKWNKNSNLVYQGRDEKGNLRYFDISFLDPYNYFKRPITAVTRDQPWEDKAADIATELLTPFLGTDITAGAVFEVMANKKEGSGAPVYQTHDTATEQAKDIGDHLRQRLQPGLLANIERTMKAVNGDVTKSGKQYNLNDELIAWLGWRASTIDPKVSLYYRSFEFSDAKAEANKKINDILQDPNEVTDKELESAYKLSTRVREKAYQEMHLIVQAARAGGVKDSEISRTLDQSGLSGEDVQMIMRGRTPEWRPTPESVWRMTGKARTLLGKERASQIRERAKKLRDISRSQDDTQGDR